MKHKVVFDHKKISKAIWYYLFLNIIVVLAVVLFFDKLPPLIPMFYGAQTGADQVATKAAIFIPTIISIIAILINMVLSVLSSDIFLKRVLVVSAGFLTFLSFYTTLRIVLLVGNY